MTQGQHVASLSPIGSQVEQARGVEPHTSSLARKRQLPIGRLQDRAERIGPFKGAWHVLSLPFSVCATPLRSTRSRLWESNPSHSSLPKRRLPTRTKSAVQVSPLRSHHCGRCRPPTRRRSGEDGNRTHRELLAKHPCAPAPSPIMLGGPASGQGTHPRAYHPMTGGTRENRTLTPACRAGTRPSCCGPILVPTLGLEPRQRASKAPA